MKRMVALLAVFALVFSMTGAAAEQPIVVGGQDTAVAFGDTVSIPDVCEIAFLNWVSGEYVTSIPVWERAEDEVIRVSSALWDRNDYFRKSSKWADIDGGPSNGYVPRYAELGYAAKASSKEYKLVDVRMNALNTQLKDMVFEETASAKLRFMGKYEFPGAIYMETTDDREWVNEWLIAPTPIPMLVTRTTHFVFEVPNAVAESKDSLVMTLTVAGQAYMLTLR